MPSLPDLLLFLLSGCLLKEGGEGGREGGREEESPDILVCIVKKELASGGHPVVLRRQEKVTSLALEPSESLSCSSLALSPVPAHYFQRGHLGLPSDHSPLLRWSQGSSRA